MRILLIEDERLMRMLVVKVLDGMASKIVEVETLEDARSASLEQEFDVILFDLVLPDSSAENSLAALPEIQRNAHAPVIVVSSWPDPLLEKKALAAGADVFLPKEQAFTNKSRAFLIALHAAVLKRPKPPHNDSFLEHVAMLERLVSAA